jgi:hypothetical protein
VSLNSSDIAVIAASSVTINAGETSAMLNVGGAGLGSATLTAVASANADSSLSSNAVPLTVVENYLQGTTNFASGATAGVMIANAFTVSTNDGASYAGDVEVTHSTNGIAGLSAETVPPALVNNASGSLALAFTQATGTITTANYEYYVISDPSGVLGDAVVSNAGADTSSDISAAAASGVELRGSNGLPLTTLEAIGNVATVPTANLVPVDAFGNAVTPFAISLSGMVSATGTIDTVDNNVVNYTSATEDNLVVNFSSPAGASLALDVVPAGTQPSLSTVFTWDTATADFTIVGDNNSLVKGGVSVNGGLHQYIATAGLGDTFNFSGTTSAANAGKSIGFVWWVFADGGVAAFDLGAYLNGNDIGLMFNPTIEVGNVDNVLNVALANLDAITTSPITFPTSIDASIIGDNSTVFILMGHQDTGSSVVNLGLSGLSVR